MTIVVPEEKVQYLKDTLPELPNAKIMRYVDDYGISHYDATMIVDVPEKSQFFDKCTAIGCKAPKLLSNWILGEISKFMNEGKAIEDTKLTAEKLVKIVDYISDGKISTAAGKTIFDIILTEDRDIDTIIEEKSLSQVSDISALEAIADEVLAANEKSVNDYNNGKTNALGYLVGQCMKASKGKANPGIMKEIILKKITK